MSTPEIPEQPPQSGHRLYEELRVGASLAVRFHAAVAAHAGINITDVTCLGALDKNGPMTPGELASLVGLTRGGTITAMVDRLERAGFVRRRRDDSDRRKVNVELLRDGAYAELTRAFDALSRSYTKVIEDYSEQDQRLLLEFNERVNAELQQRINQLQGPA